MFANLSKGLVSIFDTLRSKGRITNEDLDKTLREVRLALLEADVSLVIIKDFINKVRQEAVGKEVIKSVSAGQMIIKIIHDALIDLLRAPEDEMELNLRAQPPVAILMAGLQGSGKTTTTGKLALHLKMQKKHILLVSLDIYRPAAREQLQIIGGNIGVHTLEIIDNESVDEILIRAKDYATKGNYDIVIYDTAGRLNIDEELIDELKYIKSRTSPSETLLIVDSLMGQDAVNIARDFKEAIGITGVILTRADGDSRGGAALSVRAITNAPIKFMGIGEKPENLEVFHPERIASRILDMGDVVSLVEKAMEVSESEEMAKVTKRMEAGKFDFNDYKLQLMNIQKIGGLTGILAMMPGVGKIKDKISAEKLSEKPIKTQVAIINSMTKKERRWPEILNASRKKRIAAGSGSTVPDINKLIKQYMQISTTMKKMKNMDKKTLLRSLQGMM